MEPACPDYDPRYLAGIWYFNQRDFFEAHEVWEDLWADSTGPQRRFYQGLIQAAVALLHFVNGNLRGAVKLFHSSRAYMTGLDPIYQGLDLAAFWRQMERCFAEVLADPEPAAGREIDEDLIPTIALNPSPQSWPAAADYGGESD
jgi:hypothetical protein